MATFLIACFFSVAAGAYPAEVENIPPGRYFEVTLNEIQQAKTSIHVIMYLISLPAARAGSRVYPLVDALVDAKKRGVDVEVILDQNIDWVGRSERNPWAPAGKNKEAYRTLRESGVRVTFDDEAIYTHAKVLVIDEETVILGSTNWTEAALTRNVEGNVLIKSPQLGRELLEQYAGIEHHQPRFGTESAVQVSWAFLSRPDRIGRMVTDRDPRALDTYLTLLKLFDGNEESRVELDYGSLAEDLGVAHPVGWYSRHAIRRVLTRLQDKYRLIEFGAPRAGRLAVILKDAGDPEKLYRTPADQFVALPSVYWDWGWNRKFTFAGKVLWLVSEMYSALSQEAPIWFRSQEDIAARQGFSVWFVGDGIRDLRRKNLIEVEPSPLSPADYTNRQANRYTPNPLYDPQELERKFSELKERYGEGKVKRALSSAAAVYKDSDYRAVDRLILLEEEFGPEVVRRAVEKAVAMSGNNPKKTIGYLIATIQGIGKEKTGKSRKL